MVQPIDRILETILYVDDLDAARIFYEDVLGLTLTSQKDGIFLFFTIGETKLLLFEPTATAQNTSIPAHGATGPGHVCFAMAETELDAWREHLTGLDVTIEQDVTWPNGTRSFYFRDPAGNSLELATPKLWGFPDINS